MSEKGFCHLEAERPHLALTLPMYTSVGSERSISCMQALVGDSKTELGRSHSGLPSKLGTVTCAEPESSLRSERDLCSLAPPGCSLQNWDLRPFPFLPLPLPLDLGKLGAWGVLVQELAPWSVDKHFEH